MATKATKTMVCMRVDDELIRVVDRGVQKKVFGSRTHAFVRAMSVFLEENPIQ